MMSSDVTLLLLPSGSTVHCHHIALGAPHYYLFITACNHRRLEAMSPPEATRGTPEAIASRTLG